VAVDVVAAAASTGVGALFGGTPGAMAGAAMQPLLARALQRAGAEIGILRRQSAAKVLDDASRRLGRSPDDVVELATRSPQSAQLLAEALFAAARTVNEQKIRALARALANGLRDDEARPDEEQLVVAALGEVEAPHIKVLTHLGPERARTRTQATGLRSRTMTTRGRRPTSLAEECRLSRASVRAVLSVLERAGMAVADDGSETIRIDRLIIEMQEEVNKITDLLLNPPKNGKVPSNKKPHQLKRPGSPATAGWVITPFGQLCLDYLEDVDVTIVASDALEEGEDQPLAHD
jgi:hypothetical protein